MGQRRRQISFIPWGQFLHALLDWITQSISSVYFIIQQFLVGLIIRSTLKSMREMSSSASLSNWFYTN